MSKKYNEFKAFVDDKGIIVKEKEPTRFVMISDLDAKEMNMDVSKTKFVYEIDKKWLKDQEISAQDKKDAAKAELKKELLAEIKAENDAYELLLTAWEEDCKKKKAKNIKSGLKVGEIGYLTESTKPIKK